MADNGANDNRRNGHNQTVVHKAEELLVCDACDGRGKHCDWWGPWECGLCHGQGYITRSFWEAWVASFPAHIQAYIHSQPGPLEYRRNSHGQETSCSSLICE